MFIKSIQSLFLAVTVGFTAISFSGCTGGSLSDPPEGPTHEPPKVITGAELFSAQCMGCHPQGGNVMMPEKPAKGSPKAKDLKTFTAFIRNPNSSMPSFGPELLSDDDIQKIQEYLNNPES